MFRAPWMSSPTRITARESLSRPMSDLSNLRDLRDTGRNASREKLPSMKNRDAERKKKSNDRETWRRSDRGILRSRRSN